MWDDISQMVSSKFLFLLIILVVLAIVNRRSKEFANRDVVFVLLAGLIDSVFEVYKVHSLSPVLDGIGGFVILGISLLVFAMATNASIGGGDIKIMAAIGYILGIKLAVIAVPVSLAALGIIYIIARYTDALSSGDGFLPTGFIWLAVVIVIMSIDQWVLKVL